MPMLNWFLVRRKTHTQTDAAAKRSPFIRVLVDIIMVYLESNLSTYFFMLRVYTRNIDDAISDPAVHRLHMIIVQTRT